MRRSFFNLFSKVIILASALRTSNGLRFETIKQSFSTNLRRAIGSAMIVPLALTQFSNPSFAADQPVYFGVGCFWHVQHEFVETEKKVLNRNDDQLTSVTGYAGSTRLGKDTNRPTSKGLVCYHNMMGVGDYGSLGYGEVVQVTVPEESYPAFAKEYFSLFGSDLERPDKGDRGSEYRSLVGIPGGVESKLYPFLESAAKEKGLKLVPGKGEDPDTLGKKTVWVMDSDKYPFQQAEIYHQFHDGFMPGEQYPQGYNSLAKGALTRGLIKPTGCPDALF